MKRGGKVSQIEGENKSQTANRLSSETGVTKLLPQASEKRNRVFPGVPGVICPGGKNEEDSH